MLLEMAIGDAYGAGFEYVSRRIVEQHNDLSRYVQHPRHKIAPGNYTDDTQMSLAIAEAIVAKDPWTPEHLAERFVQAFQRDPREGYAQRFYDLLLEVQTGQALLQRIVPHSDRSGAAMRAAPVGVFSTVDEVVARCRVQAAITHNTPDGINAAIAAALATHFFLYASSDKEQLGLFLEAHVPGMWNTPWQGKVGAQGWMSVRAAITAIMQSNSMSELLVRCVAYTGDVDTVAAIALAAGSCCKMLKQDLPEHLHTTLESGQYGYDYIRHLDEALLSVVKR